MSGTKPVNRVLALFLAAGWGITAAAQGVVQFRNFYGGSTPPVDAPVTLYDGTPLDGSNPYVRAALIGGPTTATAASYTQKGTLALMYNPYVTTLTWVNFRSPPNAGYVSVVNVGRVVPGVDWGGTALVQMVVWQGNYNTWDAAYNAWLAGTPNVLIGVSNPLTLTLPASPTSPVLTYLVGLQPFHLGGMPPTPTNYFRGSYGPYDLSVNAGEPASFQVTADAWPMPYSYQWVANGTPIPGANSSVFNIANAQPGDAGQYYVIMYHNLGIFTSRTATLTVRAQAPVIITQPRSQTVPAGTTAHFVVNAAGVLPLGYQWFFNLTNAIAGATNASLDLPGVLFANSGDYTVSISNALGSVTSVPATLTVLDPYISGQPASQSVGVRQTALLSVTAQGTPPLSYQWLKGPTPLSDGGQIEGTRTPALTISNIATADAGPYSVVVSNHYGSVTSTLAELTVLDPFIVSGPLDQSVAALETATFSVETDGTPPFRYQWAKDGVALQNGGNVSGATGSVLTLAKVWESDAGSYSVTVQNAYSSIGSRKATLTVTGIPQVAFTNLQSFCGDELHWPQGGPLLSGDIIYGTAAVGAVYRVRRDGTQMTVLYRFYGTNGSHPYGGLAMSGDTLYGTTATGGTSGQGTVFKLNTDGTGFATLHNFDGDNGALPIGGLACEGDTLYGTTQQGGLAGNGTLFRINTDGTSFAVLHKFHGVDGTYPYAAPLVSGGVLYGTAERGGQYTNGTVFRIKIDGTDFTTLHDFQCTDGRVVDAGLTMYGEVLYGATSFGGANDLGTLYRLRTDGSDFATVYSFKTWDGYCPPAAPILVGKTLYGTVQSLPAVYSVQVDGTGFRRIHAFSESTGGTNADGTLPYAALIYADNTLYGTAASGGVCGGGTLFALSLPVLPAPAFQTAEFGSSAAFGLWPAAARPASCQWRFNNAPVPGATNPVLVLEGLQFEQTGEYSAAYKTVGGMVTNGPAILSVIPRVERKLVPGLSITGQTGTTVNLEYASSLGPSADWIEFDSQDLVNPTEWYFDVNAPLNTNRFYRAWQGEIAESAPSLDLHLISAIQLSGVPGTSIRIESINQEGPTNAWFAIATVQLTNTTQSYFDTSAVDQPARLYRLLIAP